MKIKIIAFEIFFICVLTGKLVHAQSDEIFIQNQRLLMEPLLEYDYKRPDTANKIARVNAYAIQNSDTTSTWTKWYNKLGQTVKYEQYSYTKDYGFTLTNSQYNKYDANGNIILVIDSAESTFEETELLKLLDQQNDKTTNNDIKGNKKTELDLAQKDRFISKKDEIVHSVFFYDTSGYMIYYYDLHEGNKVAIGYKMDAYKRLIEISIHDTSLATSNKTRIIRSFQYDSLNRIIKEEKSFIPINNQNKGVNYEKRIEIFSYEPTKTTRTVITKLQNSTDTMIFTRIFNSNRELSIFIYQLGFDTIDRVSYAYENGLLIREWSNLYNSKNPTSNRTGYLTEYEYYPNREVKNIRYYDIYTNRKKNVLKSMESFTYTYYD
jgi:hypothetical protein